MIRKTVISGSLVVTGSTNVSGNIASTGNITATYFYGDGSNLTNLPGGSSGTSYTHTSSTSAPASAATGSWWYDTTNNVLYNRVQDSNGTSAWIDVSTATSTLIIKDADSDTKIQVEESADEDKIRFDTSGSERMIIDQTGSVGIGTSSPSHKLTVSGNISGSSFYGDGSNLTGISVTNIPNSSLVNSSLNLGTTSITLGATGSTIQGLSALTASIISASTFHGDGSNLTGISASPGGSNTHIQFNNNGAFGGSSDLTWNGSTLDLNGDLIVSGTITAREFHTELVSSSILYQSGSTKFGDSSDDNHQFSGSILLSGSATVTSTVTANSFSGDGSSLTNLTASNLDNFTTDVRGQFSAGTGVSISSGQISVSSIANSSLTNSSLAIGTTSITLGATGSTIQGLTALSSSVVSASNFYGAGANLTNLTASNVDNFTTDVRGQFSAGTGISISGGSISAASVPNSSLTNSTIQFGSTPASLGDTITVIGVTTLSASSVLSGASIQAGTFTGNGASITNLTASNVDNFTTDVRGQFSAGTGISISSGQISTSGVLFNISEDTTPQLGGNLDLNGSDITGTGDISITGNLTSSGTVSASIFYGDGSNLTGFSYISNILEDTTPQLGGTLDLNGQAISGSTVQITGSISVSGSATLTNLTASGHVSASVFYGDGSNLTGISSGGGSYSHTATGSAPANPATGSWWYDTTNNVLYNRVKDDNGTEAWIDVSTATSTLVIKDADSDTKIQVEESADEDKIRFDTSGSERMIIDNSGLVGIGTSSPDHTLTVVGNISASVNISASSYYGDGSNLTGLSYLSNVSEDTTPQLGGNLDVNGNNILFGDNEKAVFGDGTDLEIYHDGSDSYIDDVGEGSIFIRSGTTYFQNLAGTKTSIQTNSGAGQSFYFNNSKTLETVNGGAKVTGNLTASGTVSGSILYGNGASITNLTASNIDNFTTDVRGQFTAGTGIGISGGTISTSGVLSNLSEDTTPQLGGNLDLNGSDITGTGDISVTGNLTSSGTVSASIFYGDGSNLTGITSGLSNIVEDTTPQLGGTLDVNGQEISGSTIQMTGSIRALAYSGGHEFDMGSSDNFYIKRSGTSYFRITQNYALVQGNGAFYEASSTNVGRTYAYTSNRVQTSTSGRVGIGYLDGSTFHENIIVRGTNQAIEMSGSTIQVTGSVKITGSLEVAGDDPSSSAIFTTVKKTVNSPGSHLYTVATASYDGLFVDYTVASGSNMRAGQITAMHNSSTVNHTETSTIDFGDTSGFNFDVVISGENMALSSSANSDGWSVKAIIRGI